MSNPTDKRSKQSPSSREKVNKYLKEIDNRIELGLIPASWWSKQRTKNTQIKLTNKNYVYISRTQQSIGISVNKIINRLLSKVIAFEESGGHTNSIEEELKMLDEIYKEMKTKIQQKGLPKSNDSSTTFG